VQTLQHRADQKRVEGIAGTDSALIVLQDAQALHVHVERETSLPIQSYVELQALRLERILEDGQRNFEGVQRIRDSLQLLEEYV
jgi:hypothetical protein